MQIDQAVGRLEEALDGEMTRALVSKTDLRLLIEAYSDTQWQLTEQKESDEEQTEAVKNWSKVVDVVSKSGVLIVRG